MSREPVFIVGLTGGIGSGKSAVAERFAALGASVVDTDRIAHTLTAAGGAAIPAIREAFGDAVIQADGALDRSLMRARVFSDPDARRQLEAILHPMIRAESEQQCHAASGPYAMLVVPLMIEKGDWRQRCQRLCVVDCPEDLQVARVQQRSGLAADEVRAILATQASRAQRQAAADDLIDNAGSLEQLQTQADALHKLYLELARDHAQC